MRKLRHQAIKELVQNHTQLERIRELEAADAHPASQSSPQLLAPYTIAATHHEQYVHTTRLRAPKKAAVLHTEAALCRQ